MTESNDRLDRVEQNLIQFSDRMTALQEFMEASVRVNQSQMDKINQSQATTDQMIANLAGLAERIGERVHSRLQQHDLELDEHDERIERLERDHTEHADRMAKLEEIQTDIRQILQFVASRLSGQ